MRAVLYATEPPYVDQIHTESRPAALLPVGDRPIIVHILEHLSSHGIKQVEIILHDMPEQVEKVLEEGVRWGISISYHLAKNPHQPLIPVLASAQKWNDEMILLGPGFCYVALTSILQQADCRHPHVITFPDGQQTGWALFPIGAFRQLDSHLPPSAILNHIAEATEISTPTAFSTATMANLAETNRRLLDKELPTSSLPNQAMTDEKIWIGRSVMIHPTAKIIPPVFIGSNTQIHDSVEVGPYAIIEGNTILDSHCVVHDSVILSNSFIGEGLDLNGCVVDRDHLYHLSLGASVILADDKLLSDLSRPTIKRSAIKILEGAIASVILLFTFPITGYLIAKHGLDTRRVISLPAPIHSYTWKTFDWIELKGSEKLSPLACWLPRLINIVRGNAHLVGLPARSREDTEALPNDWREQVLRSKIGTISPVDALVVDSQDTDQLFATEAFYATRMGWLNDFKLLATFFKKVIKGVRGSHDG